MAYKDIDGLGRSNGEQTQDTANETITLTASDASIELPNDSYIRDADFSRDGADLVLNGPDGTIIVESYFSGYESPALTSPTGAALSPELVNSLIQSAPQYAQSASTNDTSPIGAIQEISGDATITRGDGTSEPLSIGSPVYQGDIIETSADSAVNLAFVDESNFAISEESRLAIDEYVFDPETQGGVQNFSVLKGVFVYTSGLIGREDPDDVNIETPVGSIGIRGTIIAGDVDQGEITVVEGAIVLRNLTGEEMTLASQFETGKFTNGQAVQNLGQKSATDVVEKFSIVSNVAPNLFSSINDAAAEAQNNAAQAPDTTQENQQSAPTTPQTQDSAQEFDADGTTDQDGDNSVDGTVDDAPAQGEAQSNDGASLDNAAEGENQAQAEPATTQNPVISQIANAMGLNTTQSISGTGNSGIPTISANSIQNIGNITSQAMNNDDALISETAQENIQNTAQEKTGNTLQSRNLELRETEPLINPEVLDNLNTAQDVNLVNSAPFIQDLSLLGTPDEFFAASAGNTFIFNAAENFGDPDLASGGITEDLSFELSTTTTDILNGVATTAGGINLSSLLDLSAGGGDGWQFNTDTGVLELFFNDDFGTGAWGNTAVNNPTGDNFDIQISAQDLEGLTTANVVHNLDLLGNNASPITANINGSTVGDVFTDPTINDFSILVDGITVFANNDANTINIITAENVDLHTSGGNDIVDIIGNTTDNTVYLGSGDDVLKLSGPSDGAQAFGMDGEDIFEISDATLMFLNSGAIDNFVLDGGSSTGGSILDGVGDTLVFKGSQNIDFSHLTTTNNNTFSNFEFVDFRDGGAAQTVTLSFQDVIDMTDGRNTLVLNGDAGDTIDATAFSAQGDSIADGTENIGGTDYDVYEFTNGSSDVTLLVEQGVTVAV